MSAKENAQTATQVYRVYIKAPAQKVWDAITKSEWISRYGYGGTAEYELKPGGKYRGYTSEEMKRAGGWQGRTVPDLAIEGEVLEVAIPTRLVVKWHMVMDENTASDAFTRLTYELKEGAGGVTRLTLIHDLTGAPVAARILAGEWEDQGAGGGWSWVLSDLKSLLETGKRLAE